jgi:hypothetical protein
VTGITDIPRQNSFPYLVAIGDLFSRNGYCFGSDGAQLDRQEALLRQHPGPISGRQISP